MNDERSDEFEPLETALSALGAVDAEHWARSRKAFAERALAERLVDVAFETHASPLGPLLLGATSKGLVRVGLPTEDEHAVLDELARKISPNVLRSTRESLDAARHQLDEYFSGRRRAFDVPLDWRLSRGFRLDVLRVTAEIPYGRTASYRDVASKTASPAAIRATGTALATNPLPIFVPCHRVLPATGGLGNYRGGTEAKARLLDLERAR
jgi:methylated-DNA-[protein]-cysteine S-methyltransferase